MIKPEKATPIQNNFKQISQLPEKTLSLTELHPKLLGSFVYIFLHEKHTYTQEFYFFTFFSKNFKAKNNFIFFILSYSTLNLLVSYPHILLLDQ